MAKKAAKKKKAQKKAAKKTKTQAKKAAKKTKKPELQNLNAPLLKPESQLEGERQHALI